MEMKEKENRSSDALHIADSIKECKVIKNELSKSFEEPGLLALEIAPGKDNSTHLKKKMANILKDLSKDNPTVSYALLIVLMILVIIILQIPTILYATAPPSTADSSLLSSIDFDTCTVSSLMYIHTVPVDFYTLYNVFCNWICKAMIGCIQLGQS